MIYIVSVFEIVNSGFISGSFWKWMANEAFFDFEGVYMVIQLSYQFVRSSYSKISNN